MKGGGEHEEVERSGQVGASGAAAQKEGGASGGPFSTLFARQKTPRGLSQRPAPRNRALAWQEERAPAPRARPLSTNRLPLLTDPAAILERGWLRLIATVMMSPMPQLLPDWLMTWASLAPELSVTCGGRREA
jgi:hypothetical protein